MTTLNKLEKRINQYQTNDSKEFVMPINPLKISMLDNPSYYEPKHSLYLQKFLFKVESGEIENLAVSLPPRHNKSELTSLYWVIHMINKYPRIKIAIASYNVDFASTWVRRVLSFFKEFKPELLNPKKQTQYEFETIHKGGVIAVSPTSGVTGRGINIWINDDLIKSSEEANSPAIQKRNLEWYESTATTRLEKWYNGETGMQPATIMIGTIWNTQDLLWTIPDNSWTIIRLPAIAEDNDPLGRKKGEALWPEKFSEKELEKKRSKHGRYYWASMYQCQPMVYGGNVLLEKWIQYKEFKPENCLSTIMTIDPAISTLKTADDTAIVIASLMNDNSIIARHMAYGKWGFHDQIKHIVDIYEGYNPTSIVSESISYQRALAETLIEDYNIPVHQVKSRGNKNDRILGLVPLFESGKIFLHKDNSWNEYFVNQYLSWSPEVRNANDDLLDALEEAVNRLSRNMGNPYTESNVYYGRCSPKKSKRNSFSKFR